ncbi:proteasome activator complex subunit 3-like [Pectinophora gossypiella]|uniref:proteasome activator complex subunit 3-like n=1 Tax=Pectinophora gossypiella TaxID=13191 RepID=UPI00214DFBC2|nr:proteasome activator complex subunit 3-like [Pectinophora gossypiella]
MTEAAVKVYKDSLKTKAETLLLKDFPVKIVMLNDVLGKLNFQNIKLGEIHQDVNIPVPRPVSMYDEPRAKRRRLEVSLATANVEWPKVYTLPNGPAPCNKSLSDMIRTIKPHIRQLVEDSNLLKMWISYLIPKIEDGNNFGVSIQGRTLKEIQESETKAEEFLEQISDYFVTRAKIVSKVAKYPHIEDYRRAVRELDEKQYLSLWLTMCEVRNRYCVLHDIVTKNLDKIKRPRTSNTDALY